MKVVASVIFFFLVGFFTHIRDEFICMNIKMFIFYSQNFVKTWFFALVKQRPFVSMSLIWLHWMHENCVTRALR